MRAARFVTLFLFLISACGRQPTRIDLEVVADGEWTVADVADGSVLLRQMHTHNRESRERPSEPTVAILRDSLEAAELETLMLPAGPDAVSIMRAFAGVDTFHFAGRGISALTRSPADTRLYLLEHSNAIWTFSPPADLRRRTHDYGRDSLLSLQREGEVILYWATAPVWSSNGRYISFVTNRHALIGRSAQGIWLVDTAEGLQRDLLSPPNASLHTDGVFGADFIFSSSAEPGVWGVDPRTGSVRSYGDGYLAGFDPAGKAMLINSNGRYVVFRSEARDTLPAPANGQAYSTHAHFSPSGERLAIFSTDQQGSYVLHVFDAALHQLSLPIPGGPSYGPRWISEESFILAAMRPREPTRTYRARLR